MHRNAAYCLRQYGVGYAYAAFATYGYACRPIGCADTGDLSPIACGNTAPATPMPLSRHTATLVALSATPIRAPNIKQSAKRNKKMQ